MKQILFLITVLFGLLALNGCQGGYYDEYHDSNPNNLTTLFLVDYRGYAYANIPYKCDSMRSWGRTAYNGEFSFIEPDRCEFDFNGLDGIYGDNFDDIVRIVDYTYDGKGGIPYNCALFGASSTYGDGSFEYDQDDVCIFYL